MPSSGVRYGKIYEMLEVAHFRGYKRLSEFLNESWQEQALALAHYRANRQIEAVIAKRQADKARQQQQQNKKKRAGPIVGS